jgi:hypothetical protein
MKTAGLGLNGKIYLKSVYGNRSLFHSIRGLCEWLALHIGLKGRFNVRQTIATNAICTHETLYTAMILDLKQ